MKAILTKYHGPTDTRGGRISASDGDGNKVLIPYPHELSGERAHRKAAVALCAKMNWKGVLASGGTKHGYVYVWVDDDAFPVGLATCLCCGKPTSAPGEPCPECEGRDCGAFDKDDEPGDKSLPDESADKVLERQQEESRRLK